MLVNSSQDGSVLSIDVDELRAVRDVETGGGVDRRGAHARRRASSGAHLPGRLRRAAPDGLRLSAGDAALGRARADRNDASPRPRCTTPWSTGSPPTALSSRTPAPASSSRFRRTRRKRRCALDAASHARMDATTHSTEAAAIESSSRLRDSTTSERRRAGRRARELSHPRLAPEAQPLRRAELGRRLPGRRRIPHRRRDL